MKIGDKVVDSDARMWQLQAIGQGNDLDRSHFLDLPDSLSQANVAIGEVTTFVEMNMSLTFWSKPDGDGWERLLDIKFLEDSPRLEFLRLL